MSQPRQEKGHSKRPLQVEIGDVATCWAPDLAFEGILSSMSWKGILSSKFFHGALSFPSQHALSLVVRI
jgi:hypothetical protein